MHTYLFLPASLSTMSSPPSSRPTLLPVAHSLREAKGMLHIFRPNAMCDYNSYGRGLRYQWFCKSELLLGVGGQWCATYVHVPRNSWTEESKTAVGYVQHCSSLEIRWQDARRPLRDSVS